jgi:hypothetical protein
MLCVSYAPQHSPGNYRMYNLLKDSVKTSRDIRWTDWVRSDPTTILQKIQIAEETITQQPQVIRNKQPQQSLPDQRQFNSHLIPPDDEDNFGDDVGTGRNAGENPQQEEEIITTSQRRDTHGTINDETLPEQTKIQTRSRQRNNESHSESGLATDLRMERILRNLNSEVNYEKNVPNMIEDDEDTQVNRAITTIVMSTMQPDPGEPKTIDEALQGPKGQEWKRSVMSEANNFLRRDAWKEIPLEEVLKAGRKPIRTKTVLTINDEQDGTQRLKSRILTLCFSMIPGKDYTDSFSPVATDVTVRLVIGLSLYIINRRKALRYAINTKR